MQNKTKLRNSMAVGLALAMSLGAVPYNVFADRAAVKSAVETTLAKTAGAQEGVDATSSATYSPSPTGKPEFGISLVGKWKTLKT